MCRFRFWESSLEAEQASLCVVFPAFFGRLYEMAVVVPAHVTRT